MWNDPDQTPTDPYNPYSPRNPSNPYHSDSPGPYSKPQAHRPGRPVDPSSMPTDPETVPGVSPGSQQTGYPEAYPTPAQYPPQYPGGRPPRWPTPQGPGNPPPQPRVPSPPPASFPQRQGMYQPPAVPQYRGDSSALQPADPGARRSPAGRSLPHLPVAHIILVLGVLAMGLALSQVWGVNANGSAVYIRDFTNARIQNQTNVDTGMLATQTATLLVAAVAILSAALILFNLLITAVNRIFGILGLSGCASLLFFPLLWGAALLLSLALLASAGFAGLSYLSQIPFVSEHGLAISQVVQYGIGFYAWCAGIVAVFIGMLGQLALRRR
ncbi:MAG: hypothetical protein ACLQUY_03985 [Ktedonobacterales bacterium]